MIDARRVFVSPLSVAAYVTWAAVSFAVWHEAQGWSDVRSVPAHYVAAALLLVFLVMTVGLSLAANIKAGGRRNGLITAALILQVAATFCLLCQGPNSTSPVLLIIVATELMLHAKPGWCWLLLVCINVAFYVVLTVVWRVDNPIFVLTIYGGFQIFAAVTAASMKEAQLAAFQLRLTNAELLATRALLTETARDGERLRVSRELHDVVGHKLTALSLNLQMLRLDSYALPRRELLLASELSHEILSDIRSVVSSLRRHDGLDLNEALQRLIAVFPTPHISLHLQPELRIPSADQAETLLRCAQEALSNAARHAGADHAYVCLTTESNEMLLSIEDDGTFSGALLFGNGLNGLRERVESNFGSLTIDRGSYGGCRLTVRLPKQA